MNRNEKLTARTLSHLISVVGRGSSRRLYPIPSPAEHARTKFSLSLLKSIFGLGICLPVRIATGDYLFAE